MEQRKLCKEFTNRISSNIRTHSRELEHTIRREGANEGSTELYTASFGNTWFTNCRWELFWNQVIIKSKPKHNIREFPAQTHKHNLINKVAITHSPDQKWQLVHEYFSRVVNRKPATKANKHTKMNRTGSCITLLSITKNFNYMFT